LWLAASERLMPNGGWIRVADHLPVATSNCWCVLLELGLIYLFSSSKERLEEKKKETWLNEQANWMKMLRRIPVDDSRVRLLVVRRLPPTHRRRYRLVYRILWSTTHQGDTKGRIAAARRNTKEHRTASGRIRGGRGRSDVHIRSDWIFLYLWAWYAPVVRGPPGPPCSSAPA